MMPHTIRVWYVKVRVPLGKAAPCLKTGYFAITTVSITWMTPFDW